MKRILQRRFSIKRIYFLILIPLVFLFALIFYVTNADFEYHVKNSEHFRDAGIPTNAMTNTPNSKNNQPTEETHLELTQEERHRLLDSFHCKITTLGCFPYVNKSKGISSTSSLTMTRKDCLVQCSKKSLPLYVGLTHGNTCLCTTKIASYTTFLSSDQCSSKCIGNQNETCGGENGIEWYAMQTPCMKDKDLSEEAQESLFIGCYDDDIKHRLMTSIDVGPIFNLTRSNCIFYCGVKRSPLAFVDGATSTCTCSKFTKTSNWTLVTKNCDEKSLKIFRTFAEDERCEPLKFLPFNSTVKKSVLLSFPGSGNTWTRHMIEQASGIYTGSVYGDVILAKSGFLGEMPIVSQKYTFVIKEHIIRGTIAALKNYHSIIFLVRNPYPAYIAEFNRMQSNSHIGSASKNAFLSKKFNDSVYTGGGYMTNWDVLFKYVVQIGKPFYLLRYETLLDDPMNEVRKVLKFLEITNGFKQEKLEQRLLCLSQNLQGGHKRKKIADAFDPFTNKLKTKVNSMIEYAENSLASIGVKANFTSYKRSLTGI